MSVHSWTRTIELKFLARRAYATCNSTPSPSNPPAVWRPHECSKYSAVQFICQASLCFLIVNMFRLVEPRLKLLPALTGYDARWVREPGSKLRGIELPATAHSCTLYMQISGNVQFINRSISTCHLSADRFSQTGASLRRTGQWRAVKRRNTSDGTVLHCGATSNTLPHKEASSCC